MSCAMHRSGVQVPQGLRGATMEARKEMERRDSQLGNLTLAVKSLMK